MSDKKWIIDTEPSPRFPVQTLMNAAVRIASYKLTVIFSDGDRRLMGIAYRKATSAV